MKTCISMTIAFVAFLAFGSIANAETWDCNADYVSTGSSADPHGWSSGNISNPDTAASFAPLDNAEWIFNNTTVHKYQTGYGQPDELYNNTDADFWIDSGTVLVKSKTLTRHSGNSSGLLSSLRWTAPAAGNYQVDAQIFGVCNSTSTVWTNSMIVKNLDFVTKIAEGSTTLFYTNENATTFAYSGTLSLAAGDTLDFVNDGRYGSGGRPNNVAFDVTITAIPEPSTLTLLPAGAFGLLAYAWRKRK